MDTQTKIHTTIDWKGMVADFQVAGWPLQELADAAGIPISSLRDIQRGKAKEPTGARAVRFFLLHGETFPRKHRTPHNGTKRSLPRGS